MSRRSAREGIARNKGKKDSGMPPCELWMSRRPEMEGMSKPYFTVKNTAKVEGGKPTAVIIEGGPMAK